MDIERFTKLKKQVEHASREQAKTEGALEQLKARLKEEFGCSSLKKADQLLEELAEQEAALEEKFNTALAALEEEYHG